MLQKKYIATGDKNCTFVDPNQYFTNKGHKVELADNMQKC
jgi:hypothetical protein